ncbi:solute carrier organic anion transporter family member 5A1-like [Anneissia japonica]|uniref:solute carrier organic anion transporter family member 5A1-like n=1 Tax=Anneissia japonica TaxID=1529436 RepID=UPI001425666D|nr:solute carrier organic anion transporter family member 5A1-like [Anneissia japonica]
MYKYDSLPNVDGNEQRQEKHHTSSHTTRPYSRRLNHDDNDTNCLIHRCNCFNNPVAFLTLIILLYTVLVAAGAYLGGSISTIEKQFQLSSSESGFIATVNDIVTLSLVIFITYYGAKFHRPRILCVSGIIVGIGHFLFSIPHFTSEPILNNHLVLHNDSDGTSYIDTDNELCFSDVVQDGCAPGGSKEGQQLGVAWLIMGQILIGIGSAPMFPLILTYLDDSTVDSTTMSIYIGKPSLLSMADPQFFKQFQILVVVVIVPPVLVTVIYFVRICISTKGLMKAMKRIITNPTIVFLKLTVACDLAIVAGFMFFVAKYIEKQFAVSAATASIILGVINLPGSVCANIASSFFVRKFKLTPLGLCKMLAILSISSLLFGIPLLFIGCSNPAVAGVTTFYNTTYKQGSLPNVNNICNSNCACSENVYNPVCGSDGITYTSACHAGCIDVWNEEMKDELGDIPNNDTIFIGCSCIVTGDVWETTDGLIEGGIATEGSCDWTCDKILPFVLIVAIITIFAAMKTNPNLMLSLRSVDPNDRALGIAFGSVVIRVLGYFPAPIYFGAVISSACLIRQESCGREGACLVYDLERYRYSFIGLFVGLKVLVVVLTFCVYGSINRDRLKNKSKPSMELVENDIVPHHTNEEEICHTVTVC